MGPNILLILADQHRADTLGCAGHPVSTPRLDALAREGMRFTRAFTPCPVCAPARQALLSGRAPESFGALWNPDFVPTPTVRPNPAFHTAQLSTAGWACALVGKWNSSIEYSPADFGFAEHIDSKPWEALISRQYPSLGYENGWFGEASPVALEHSKTHWMAARACELMRRHSGEGRPWFVRADFSDPHPPCRPSKPFAGLHNPDAVPPWPSFGDPLEGKPYIQRQQRVNWGLEGRPWQLWKHTVASYCDMLSQIDDAVGLMLDQVDALGEAQDTLVLYSSDHGDLCGGHGMLDKHYVLYDDVTQVPLLARWPGHILAGQACDAFVSNCLDLGATIGELCGLPVDAGHGRSLVPLLCGEGQAGRNFAVSAASGQQFGLYSQRSIRTAEWLYVWNLTDVDELYHVADDPGQHHNRIAEPALQNVLSQLRRTLYGELLRREDLFARSHWLDAQMLRDEKLLSH